MTKLSTYKLAPWITPMVVGPDSNGIAVLSPDNVVIRFANTLDTLENSGADQKVINHQTYELDLILYLTTRIDFKSDNRMRLMNGFINNDVFTSDAEITGIFKNPPFQKEDDDDDIDEEDDDECFKVMQAIGNGLNEATEICGDEVKANEAGFAMLSNRLIEQLGVVDYKRLYKDALKRRSEV